MELREEKLSLITLLFIVGISSLLFTLVMKVLDGVTIRFFLQTGLICIIAGTLLFVIQQLSRSMHQGKTQRKYHQ